MCKICVLIDRVYCGPMLLDFWAAIEINIFISQLWLGRSLDKSFNTLCFDWECWRCPFKTLVDLQINGDVHKILWLCVQILYSTSFEHCKCKHHRNTLAKILRISRNFCRLQSRHINAMAIHIGVCITKTQESLLCFVRQYRVIEFS